MATVSSLLPRTVASLRRHPPPPNSKSKHPSPSISASSWISASSTWRANTPAQHLDSK